MNVALLNDTFAWYHWGCTATSGAIRRRIERFGGTLVSVPVLFTYRYRNPPHRWSEFESAEFFKTSRRDNRIPFAALEDADVVVVNGEGSLHGASSVARALLYMAYAAKRFLGKPVHLINHSPYPGDPFSSQGRAAYELYAAVYKTLDYVAIREPLSHHGMEARGFRGVLSGDCLPLTVCEEHADLIGLCDRHRNERDRPRIVVSGSVAVRAESVAELVRFMRTMAERGYAVDVLVGARAHPAADDVELVRSLQSFDDPCWQIVDAASLEEWLTCIARAEALVSGRFHHTLAAASLQTPPVVLRSNTPKNLALCHQLGLPAPLCYSDGDLGATLVEAVDRALERGPVDRAIIDSLLPQADRNFVALRELLDASRSSETVESAARAGIPASTCSPESTAVSSSEPAASSPFPAAAWGSLSVPSSEIPMA